MKAKENRTAMRRLTCLFLTGIILFIASLSGRCETGKRSKSGEPVEYVNPFIGTDKEGNAFPGACLPFGMVQLSPDNGSQGVKAYNYARSTILGFSHTQLSGTGDGTLTNYCNILIMPTTGDLKLFPGMAKSPDRQARRNLEMKMNSLSEADRQEMEKLSPADRRQKFRYLLQAERQKVMVDLAKGGQDTSRLPKGYESAYSHADEEASPGYYAVLLKDYQVKAELTATERAGFHRYTFPATKEAHVVIDVTHSLATNRESFVKILSNNQIEGFVTTDEENSNTRPLKCYFHAEFNKPFSSFGSWNGDDVRKDSREISGLKGVGAWVNFSTLEEIGRAHV